jgi:hypothetical protein
MRRQKKSYDLELIVGAASARATTLGARVRRSHHADFAAAPRSGASVLMMFIAAAATRGVACRQRQAGRVCGEKALAREAMGSRAGVVAWLYRDRVELRFRRTRLGGRLFPQSEQLAQRPFDGHRCNRLRAGRTCIRGDATTLFLRRGRNQLLERAQASAQAAQERSGISAALQNFHERRCNDDAVDVRCKSLHLLAAADAETRAHRQR